MRLQLPPPLCPAGGPGLTEALAATTDFVNIVSRLSHGTTEATKAIFAHGSPLVLAEALALQAALLSWALYLVTRNCSQVDRMWSIMPPIYVAVFAWRDLAAFADAVRTVVTSTGPGAAGRGATAWLAALSAAVVDSGADLRLVLATALSAAWGCRLTYNFWRRGGYNPRFEDHRWPEVRKIMHPVLFELFNLVFVALAQHALCLAITLPAFVATTVRGSSSGSGSGNGGAPLPLGPADWAAAATFALFLLGETLADQQQWAFQCRKHALIAARQPRRGDYKRGFRTTGLFRFSRHPNFFCEYGMWWSFYVLCAVLPSGCLLGWSAVGAVGLTLLFHAGSLWITERISAARYPAYAAYQATTSAIMPGWPGPRLPDDGSE